MQVEQTSSKKEDQLVMKALDGPETNRGTQV